MTTSPSEGDFPKTCHTVVIYVDGHEYFHEQVYAYSRMAAAMKVAMLVLLIQSGMTVEKCPPQEKQNEDPS
jgi:hypothetical protein